MLTVSLRTFLICSIAECVDNNAIEMCMPTWCVVYVNSKWRLYKLWVPSLLLLNKETNLKVCNFPDLLYTFRLCKKLFLTQYSSIVLLPDYV